MRALLLALFCVLMTACGRGPRWVEKPHQFQPGCFDQLSAQMLRTAEEGLVPTAVLRIHSRGEVAYEESFGRFAPEDRSPKVTGDALFDLASLTKPLAAAPASLLFPESSLAVAIQHRNAAHQENEYQLALSVVSLGRIPPPRVNPIPVSKDVYQYGNMDIYLSGIYTAPTTAVMEARLREAYWSSMGATGLTWKPVTADTVWSSYRRDDSVIRATPFDPLADATLHRIDRAPLHSGLFGSARDVCAFGDALLKPSTPEQIQLSDLLLGAPEARRDVSGEWGEPSRWITPGGMTSPASPPFAREGGAPGRYFLQTGYTGCLLWIDRDAGTVAVLLTNAAGVGPEGQQAFDRLTRRIIPIIIRGTAR